jgi:hypothetical protein
MAKTKSKKTNVSFDQLEVTLNEYFAKKAPQLPKKIKDIFVKIAPYIAIVSVIITVPSLLLILGLGGVDTVLAPMGGVQSMSALPTMWLSIVLLIPVVILEILAIPGLFGRKMVGWKYMYWAIIISIISNIVQFNIIGAIITFIVNFYILFQIRSYYK